MSDSPLPILKQAEIVRQELLVGESRSATIAVEAASEDELTVGLVELLEEELEHRHEAIRAVMSLLERSMEHAPAVTGHLMASLYPLASESYLHETCDAIDIWLQSQAPRDLASAFRRKASKATGYMRGKYLEWAGTIEERC